MVNRPHGSDYQMTQNGVVLPTGIGLLLEAGFRIIAFDTFLINNKYFHTHKKSLNPPIDLRLDNFFHSKK
jgi:hypothetical protein